jgi:hypothetical protein
LTGGTGHIGSLTPPTTVIRASAAQVRNIRRPASTSRKVGKVFDGPSLVGHGMRFQAVGDEVTLTRPISSTSEHREPQP